MLTNIKTIRASSLHNPEKKKRKCLLLIMFIMKKFLIKSGNWKPRKQCSKTKILKENAKVLA